MTPEELKAMLVDFKSAQDSPHIMSWQCAKHVPALVAEVERLTEDQKKGGIDHLKLVDKCDALELKNARLTQERDEAAKWGGSLSSRRFSDRNDHALRSRLEKAEAKVERLQRIVAAAKAYRDSHAAIYDARKRDPSADLYLLCSDMSVAQGKLFAAIDAAEGGE